MSSPDSVSVMLSKLVLLFLGIVTLTTTSCSQNFNFKMARLLMITIVLSWTQSLSAGQICDKGDRVHTAQQGGQICEPCELGVTYMDKDQHSETLCYRCSKVNEATEMLLKNCSEYADTISTCKPGFFRQHGTVCQDKVRSCRDDSDAACCSFDKNYIYIKSDGSKECRLRKFRCNGGEYYSIPDETCLPCPANVTASHPCSNITSELKGNIHSSCNITMEIESTLVCVEDCWRKLQNYCVQHMNPEVCEREFGQMVDPKCCFMLNLIDKSSTTENAVGSAQDDLTCMLYLFVFTLVMSVIPCCHYCLKSKVLLPWLKRFTSKLHTLKRSLYIILWAIFCLCVTSCIYVPLYLTLILQSQTMLILLMVFLMAFLLVIIILSFLIIELQHLELVKLNEEARAFNISDSSMNDHSTD